MKLIVGTTSERKVESVKKLLTDITKQKEITVIPFAAKSNIAETPYDKETYDGAKNRALDCKTNNKEADYFIGIESGLVKDMVIFTKKHGVVC